MQSTRERLKANRKKRRLRLLRLFFIAAVIIGALAGAWRWATSPGTAFGSIVIEGTSQLTQSELLSMCGTQEPVNLFVVSPSAIEKAIANDVRFEKAETEYFWPGVLVVRVKERIPALYIACSNVIGVFGVKPPTKDLDVTAALALMSIVLIEYAGVRARGGAGFLKSLAAPTPIMTPMNILEIAIRPTSLCMRLFGNVLGAFVIMELLKLVVPVFVPAVFSLYFDLFDGLIQTYVFVFLTALFMKESIGGEE